MRAPIVVLLSITTLTPLATGCATLPLGARATCKSPTLEAAGLHADALRHVVTVRTDQRTGTGFLAVDGERVVVVTNQHVVAGARAVELDVPMGPGMPPVTLAHVEVTEVDVADDLAVLVVPGLRKPGDGLSLAPGAPMVGQPVLALGFPHVDGSRPTLTAERGDITAATRELAGRTYVQTNANINSGSSGGPVLDACGRVLGVVVATVGGVQRTGLIIPQERVRALLERLDGTASPRLDGPASAAQTARSRVDQARSRAEDLLAALASGSVVAVRPLLAQSVVEFALPQMEQAIDAALRDLDALTARLAKKGVALANLPDPELQRVLRSELSPASLAGVALDHLMEFEGVAPLEAARSYAAAESSKLMGRPTHYRLGAPRESGDRVLVDVELRLSAADRAHTRWLIELETEGGEWFVSSVSPR